METYKSVLATVCVAGTLVTSPIARAACVEDPRRVELSKDNIVRVKSYLCREGQGSEEVQFKIEFHRFGDTAGSLIVGKSSSSLLKRTIGSPEVIENEVFATYADLLKRFGETDEVPANEGEITTSFRLGVPGATTVKRSADKIYGRTFRTLMDSANTPAYPAVTEIQTLIKNAVPTGIQFYYGALCLDDGLDSSGANTCRQYDKRKVKTVFWRGLRPHDFADYSANAKAYNTLVRETYRRKRKKFEDWDLFDEKIDNRYFRLLNHLSNQNWPEDFFILQGEYAIVECGTDAGKAEPAGPFGWNFGYTLRSTILDAVLIRNQSRGPIKLERLLGGRSAETNLRAAPISVAPEGLAQSVGDLSKVLGLGESVLIPTQLTFGAPRSFLKETLSVSNEIQRRGVTSSFPGNTSGYGVPKFKEYVYGPQLAIRGFIANGKVVDLGRRATNFLDLTVASEAGSCPYLLSSENQGRTWLNHGKVLDKAPNKEREYAEMKSFAGFRPQFRIEEREPEMAFIDQAELLVILKSNRTITLKPDHAGLAARDDNYVHLYWGDAVEFSFQLPSGVKEEDVTESRLVLTGYYERYSAALAFAPNQGRGTTTNLLLQDAQRATICVPRNTTPAVLPRLRMLRSTPAMAPASTQ